LTWCVITRLIRERTPEKNEVLEERKATNNVVRAFNLAGKKQYNAETMNAKRKGRREEERKQGGDPGRKNDDEGNGGGDGELTREDDGGLVEGGFPS
jgi:hypothetical protein